ncbi:hypothetical protein [Sorangium sp. So ce233]|uniref:hypothetical protein n=1 Tax=Sorangium sp. So ce233 TaxID=3133290 RepID=UPI003F638D2A
MRAGLPRDPAQWIALALSLAALLAGAWLLRRGRSPATSRPAPRAGAAPGLAIAAALAVVAALISAAYVAVYLRGGPRIIDATSYWLEARAMAAGYLAWPLDEPAASVLGRFLVRSDAAAHGAAALSAALPGGAAPGDVDRVAVIFPPGYPALLALGFLAGAPLAVGPLLAGALAIATYDLAARFAPEDPAAAGGAARIPFVPVVAALFSALCAALRYHTADTMSHGLAALCFTVALASARRALDEARDAPTRAPTGRLHPAVRAAALAGLAAGWLAATRPPSALALAAALLLVLLPASARGPAMAGPREGDPAPRPTPRLGTLAAAMGIGALPGLALLAAHQRAATGGFASSQAAYYAVSDGPPGCFRYGFGAGVGCLGEHGDFVRHNLAEGYGFLAVAGTTLRRLKLHLVDALNAEPLALLVIVGAAIALRHPRSRPLAVAPLLQIAAYAPFYFDGNYPGGGARFFADVLPIEHVLAAMAALAIAQRGVVDPRAREGRGPAGRPRAPLAAALVAAALALAGFAFRAGFDHAALRDREGGLPMFDPASVARAGVARGLVFVDTDHGFNLGFDPAPGDVAVLRYRGDAVDRMAWEARGRPPAYRYRFAIPDGGGLAAVSIAPLVFEAPGAPLRDAVIEGESLWPPRAQRDAWALPEHAGGTCASGGRLLAVHAAAGGAATASGAASAASDASVVRVGLPAPWLRGARISPRVAISGDGAGEVRLLVDGALLHVWRVEPAAPGASAAPGSAAPLTCAELPPHPIPERAVEIELSLARRSAAGAGAGAASPPESAESPRRRAGTEGTEGGAEGLFALDAVRLAGGNSVDR